MNPQLAYLVARQQVAERVRGAERARQTERSGSAKRLTGVRRILLFDLVGPLIAYSLLTDQGTSNVLALTISGALPAVGVLIELIEHRSVDLVGAAVLAGVALGVALGLITRSGHAVLLDGSVLTAAFAIAALTSLRAPRPLMFLLVLGAMGGSHSDAGKRFDRRYVTEPGLAGYFRLVTRVWGIAFFGEAGLKVIVIQTASTGFALAFTRIVPYVLICTLLLWMIIWGRMTRRATADDR